MSEPANTDNSAGLLKKDYGDDGSESELQRALRRKREKLKASRLGAEDEENG